MGKKNSDFFLLYLHNEEWFKFFFNIFFKGKKLMQGLESPLQPKGLGFEPFLELPFSSRNKMHVNKFLK